MTLPSALLLAVLAAEPGALPAGVHAVPIQEGSAVVILDGKPSDAPLRLPAGWYFTAEGYDRLSKATAGLQTAVQRLEASTEVLRAPCPDMAAPVPVVVKPSTGWPTKTLVVAVLVAGAIGLGVGVALK